MIRHCVTIAAVVGSLITVCANAADQAADAIVERAIQAAGGRDAIARYKRPFYCEREGKYFGPNGDGHLKQRITEWLPDKIRAEYESATLDGKTTSQVRVFDGKLARDKRLAPGSGQLQVVDLPENVADQWRDRLHADWLATLLPLVEEDVKLQTVDEIMIADRPAVGISCSKKDRGEARLYFDKQTYRLMKSVYQRRSDGKLFEDRFDDHAELDGLFYPRGRTVYFDGVKKMELQTTTLKIFDTLPEVVFTTP